MARDLDDFLADMAEHAFGERTTPALLCRVCKQPGSWYSEAGRREFAISQICEKCFDAMFADDDE